MIKARLMIGEHNTDSLIYGFNVHIISEGYLDEESFLSDIFNVEEQLRKLLYPVASGMLNIYSYYIPNQGRVGQVDVSGNLLSAFKSQYSSTSSIKRLQIDYDNFLSVFNTLQIDNGGLCNLIDYHNKPGGWKGTILILTPDVATYTGVSVVPLGEELYASCENNPVFTFPNYGQPPVVSNDIYYAATSMNGCVANILARGIGRGLGLFDESDYSLHSDFNTIDISRRPNDTDILVINTSAPNLYVNNDVSEELNANFKWYDFLTLAQKDSAGSLISDLIGAGIDLDPFQFLLYEGGAGFAKDVYRSGLDCFMRRRPGIFNDETKLNLTPPCPACRAHLTNFFLGSNSSSLDRKTILLGTQKSKFDDIKWQGDKFNCYKLSSINPYSTQQNITADSSNFNIYWIFNLVCNESSGFFFSSGKIVNPEIPLAVGDVYPHHTVFKYITFSNVMVSWANGGPDSVIDIPSLISDPYTTLSVGQNGCISTDDKYQYGFKLDMKKVIDNRAEVNITLSLVFRGAEADFDPAGSAFGCKLYPQIVLWYKPIGNSDDRITKFTAFVDITPELSHVMPNAGPSPSYERHYEGLLSFFTDSNISKRDDRISMQSRMLVEKWDPATRLTTDALNIAEDYIFPSKVPTWANLFDYILPDLKSEKIILGLEADPSFHNSASNSYRHAKKTWPLIDTDPDVFKLTIQKRPRQREYDNFHIHSYMGVYPFQVDRADGSLPTLANIKRIMAPFCGTDCLHLHWRWSYMTEVGALSNGGVTTAMPFRGWGRDKYGFFRKNLCVANPLVEPNQSLSIHVLADNSPSFIPRNDLLDSNISGSSSLGIQKRLIYKANIVNPIPGMSYVVLEQGLAFAIKPKFSWRIDMLLLVPALANTLLHHPGLFGSILNDTFFENITTTTEKKILFLCRKYQTNKYEVEQLVGNYAPTDYDLFTSMGRMNLIYDFIRFIPNLFHEDSRITIVPEGHLLVDQNAGDGLTTTSAPVNGNSSIQSF